MVNVEKHLKKSLWITLFLTFILFTMIFSEIYIYGSYKFSFLIVNVILAWIPFLSSTFISTFDEQNKRRISKIFITLTFGAVWFIFYPNVPYLLTDLIHIQQNGYIRMSDYIFTYNENFLIWYEFVELVLAAFIGIIIGFFSLFSIQRIFERRKKFYSGWLFVICISFISGLGIYIGRFLRFNSWDLLSSLAILNDLSKIPFGAFFKFSFMIGGLWFLIYLSIRLLIFDKKQT